MSWRDIHRSCIMYKDENKILVENVFSTNFILKERVPWICISIARKECLDLGKVCRRNYESFGQNRSKQVQHD